MTRARCTADTGGGRREGLAAIRSALRQAGHVVPNDPRQLAGQLVGRLATEGNPGVIRLVEDASRWRAHPWLRPRTAMLSNPRGPLLHTLTGHGSPVDAVAITPDGRIALSGDVDGVIKLWDLEQGREVHTLTGHGSYITTLAVTPDGTTAVSGSYDKTVRVWDLGPGSTRHVLKGHPASIFSLAMTPDGRRAASGCRKTMRVWDLERGVELGSVRHRGNGLDVTIDADGLRAICQGKKGILRMTLADGHLEPPIEVESAGRYFKALSPDARLALTDDSSILTKWDVRLGRAVRRFTEHGSSIQGLALAPDGRYAATISVARSGWASRRGPRTPSEAGAAQAPRSPEWEARRPCRSYRSRATVGGWLPRAGEPLSCVPSHGGGMDRRWTPVPHGRSEPPGGMTCC